MRSYSKTSLLRDVALVGVCFLISSVTILAEGGAPPLLFANAVGLAILAKIFWKTTRDGAFPQRL